MVTEARPRLLLEWDDEATRARRRESTMAAVILHLGFVILILINPQIFPQGILSAEEAREEARRTLTLLYLPSDLLKIPEPRTPPDLTPEERRRAVVRTPLTVDPEELQRILPPRPPTVTLPPGGTAGSPSVPGPNSESAAAEGGREQESNRGDSQRQIARLENVPRPQRETESPLQLPMATPGRMIEESLRRSQGAGTPGGPPGDFGLPSQPNLNTPFPLILSDTRGVDFGPYLIRLVREVRRNWYAVIPESVRWGEQGKVVIVFTIQKDGAVPLGQPTLVRSSGRSHLDRPALAAIRASQPFPPLPQEFSGEHIVLQFTFLYNLPVDYTGP